MRPCVIASEEELGRVVSGSNNVKQGRNGRISMHAFFHRARDTISVHRLSLAPESESEEQGRRIAGNRVFGWAVVRADVASRLGRSVRPSPLDSNPFHADIILPKDAVDDVKKKRRHAQLLADRAYWRDSLSARKG